MHTPKPEYHKFCEALRGYDIQKIRNQEIIPRFIVYHSLAPENLIAIMNNRHPMYKWVDRKGWRGGIMMVVEEDIKP